MDNYQKSLAWQCYRGASPFRYGSSSTQTCLRCGQNSETNRHAIVQFPKISEQWVYVDQLLLRPILNLLPDNCYPITVTRICCASERDCDEYLYHQFWLTFSFSTRKAAQGGGTCRKEPSKKRWKIVSSMLRVKEPT